MRKYLSLFRRSVFALLRGLVIMHFIARLRLHFGNIGRPNCSNLNEKPSLTMRTGTTTLENVIYFVHYLEMYY